MYKTGVIKLVNWDITVLIDSSLRDHRRHIMTDLQTSLSEGHVRLLSGEITEGQDNYSRRDMFRKVNLRMKSRSTGCQQRDALYKHFSWLEFQPMETGGRREREPLRVKRGQNKQLFCFKVEQTFHQACWRAFHFQ